MNTLRESAWCPVPDLTQEQARALEALGQELSASTKDTDESTSLIQCRFTTSGVWEVRVAEAIGLVGVDSSSWPVEPKIPANHFHYLLSRGGVLPSLSTDAAEMAQGGQFWQLIFDWYLTSTETLLRTDLARGYTVEVDDLPYIRGTVDTLSLTRGLLRGHTRVRCTFEQFKADIPINRVLKSALMRGLATGRLSRESARRARRLLARFSDVREASHSDLRAQVDRSTNRYKTALPLARHILSGQLRELAVGDARAWCFLWRTPDAIETGLREVLREGLADICRITKDMRSYGPLSFNPDLRFEDTAVGDIKYSVGATKWDRAHVYQLLAFSVAYRCAHALVVNFHRTGAALPSVKVGDTTLHNRCWRLDTTPEEAAGALTADVRTWLAAPGQVATT